MVKQGNCDITNSGEIFICKQLNKFKVSNIKIFCDSFILTILLFSPCANIVYCQTLTEINALIDSKDFKKADSVINVYIESASESDSLLIYELYKNRAKCKLSLNEVSNAILSWEYLIGYYSLGQKQLGDCHAALGTLFYGQGNYKNYVQQYELAKEAYLLSHGQNATKYIGTLNTLGFAYKLTGEYSKALSILIKAKKIKEDLNEVDLQYAKILNNLGIVYVTLNNFKYAEDCIKRSLEIKATISNNGKKDVDYGMSLFFYTTLLQAVSRNDEALQKIQDALEIFKQCNATDEKILSAKQVEASVFQSLGNIDEAIKLYEEIKAERERLKQENNSNYGTTLYDLANLYSQKLNYNKAFVIINRAIDVFEKCLSSDHPYYAQAVISKADIMLAKGETKNIALLYNSASKVIAKKYTKNHIEYFKCQFSYFKYLKIIGKRLEASNMIDQLDKIITSRIKESTDYLSMKEISELGRLYHNYFQELLSLATTEPSNLYLAGKAMDASLFYKGSFLQAAINIKNTLKEGKEYSSLYYKNMEYRSKIVELQQADTVDRRLIEALQDSIQANDREFARSLGRMKRVDKVISWMDVQSYLLEGHIAIDYLRVNAKTDNEVYYIAIILLPNSEAPTILKLFTESELKSLINKSIVSNFENIDDLYLGNTKFSLGGKQNLSLYDLVWRPITPYLKSIQQINVSKDGELRAMSIQAIYSNFGIANIDLYKFKELTSLRDLAKPGIPKKPVLKKKAIGIGPIDQPQWKDNFSKANMNPLSAARSKNGYWASLPETEIELKEITSILTKSNFDAELLVRNDANKLIVEQVLSDASDLQILHFATHGYFETENLYGVRKRTDDYMIDLEMSRSAIVLANANLLPGKEAVLTAYEVSQFNLENTELVVLSACETGLGQIYESEGVYGLQRAFKIAGAEYIIMSLWKVPDRETRMFMVDFYENYLSKKLPIVEAFHESQKKMRDQYPKEPAMWAGFVLMY